MLTNEDWNIISLLLAFVALALILAGAMDARDAERSHQQYCAMVALWDSDAAQDVAPEQRRGWPPYDGRKQCKDN